jgi:hypothetical protein
VVRENEGTRNCFEGAVGTDRYSEGGRGRGGEGGRERERKRERGTKGGRESESERERERVVWVRRTWEATTDAFDLTEEFRLEKHKSIQDTVRVRGVCVCVCVLE